MKIGFYTWGSCLLERPGLDGPDPYTRHHGAADYDRAYAALRSWAQQADELGYESFWVTEHHFQREGYEIVPNVVLLAAVLAQHTRRIRFGAFFHVVPAWHPLRLAEDLAMADLLTGGRVVFGAGRGSVEREARTFGAGFGRGGDGGDALNRSQFEEQMRIIALAWSEREFSFHGKFYDLPPAGILNTGNAATGRPWTTISLVPQPLRPIPVYQACTSDETFHFAARNGHTAVLPLYGGLERTRERWRWYGELLERYHGRQVGASEKRMLLVSVHLGDDREAAIAELAPAFTERNRFLAQQRSVGVGRDGRLLPVGYVPTMDEVLAGGAVFVDSPANVAEQLATICGDLCVEELAVEMGFPGMSEEQISRQLRRFAVEVRPELERAGLPVAP